MADPTSKVFISYSRKDKVFVRKLNQHLDDAGVGAWVDWEGIHRHPGPCGQRVFPFNGQHSAPRMEHIFTESRVLSDLPEFALILYFV